MKKILIVEDDTDIQDIFRLIFSSYGYEVDCVDNGKDVFERIETLPDAIVLDKQLPGMSGIDVCKKLKTDSKTRHIPVLMISATSGVESAAKNAGADAFLEKPFNMHVVLNKVSSLFERQ